MPMQKLLDVQRVDLKIKDLETEVAAIPLKLQEFDRAIGARRMETKQLRAAIDEIKKAQRQIERQLDQKQGELTKYNAQLPMIKTNREYKAILVEIDSAEKEISDLEEDVLTKMAEVEEMERKATAKEEEVTRAEEETNKEKANLEEKQKELEDILKGSRSTRESIASNVDEALLGRYDRIRIHKGGLALSHIDDESCGACHVALPPQVVNEVIGGKIKSCPSCNRLLYWNEQ